MRQKTVYRNDTESSIGAVSQYDVLYYLEEISTVWAYSNKQTGTIEAVLPSRSNPTSVTIAGKNFTRLARHRRPPLFRPMVHIKWGGYCNAAFGRDNTVAAVISAEEINTTVYGVVAGTGKTEYVTPSGDKYTAKYIDVVASDGVTYRHASDYNAAAGTRSITTGDSGVTVKKLSRNSNVTGTVNASGTAAGKIAFADNLEILDVYQNTAVSIPASRLRIQRLIPAMSCIPY